MISQSGISILREFPKEFSKSIEFGSGIVINQPIDKIIVAGMGGSSFPGSICKTYLEDFAFNIPIEINRDYSLHKNVSDTSLVFVSSFSGNTDEAIKCYYDALTKKCKTVVITSGGQLLDLALMNETPLARIIINSDREYRCVSTGYFIGIILSILENSGLICGAIQDLKQTENYICGLRLRTKARTIAKKIAKKIPIIYTSTKFEESIARIIKINFNEKVKIPAFYNVFPELTHYEPLGFTHYLDNFHFLLIEDPSDDPKVKAHMNAFEKAFIKGNKSPITKITMAGENTLQKIIGVIFLFEWISLYLADIYGVDPFSYKTTNDLKNFISLEKG